MRAGISETVLITGASSGIGLELARCFAAEYFGNDGCRMILVARNTQALENLADELNREYRIQTTVLTADLSLPETPKRIFSELQATNIHVDVLVNNAGFGLHGAFDELDLHRQMEMVQVNVAALTELTRLFLPGMIRSRRGGILNVGSVAGFVPGPNMAVYFATKAFVQSFSEALAGELSGTGVTVTALCPGPTATNFSQVARGQRTPKFQVPKMPAATVARYGYYAFRRGKVVAVPGFGNRFLIFSTRIGPRSQIRKAVKYFNKIKK
ncbi:MAG TPA: SDR family oxidoreductase [Verrucomicrobiae bacterium]|nr:SDR family oxidoreductase [Verrucomicrobiae bacterium]